MSDNNVLNLDHEHLKKLVVEKNYPEEVRNAVIWLGDFTRDRCQGKVSILQDRIKRFKLGQTDNYFYKVLSGRYFVDKQGNRIGSIRNFVEVVSKLQSAFVLSTKSGAVSFIETTTYRTIADYIDVKSAQHTICKFGVIIGHTGSQKTASYKQICLEKNPEDENLRKTCVRVEAPDSTSIAKFRTDLCAAFGGSRILNQQTKYQFILANVDHNTTIILDNCQRLYVEGDRRQPIFEFLIKLQEDTGCTPILSLTPDSQLRRDLNTNAFFEQIIGRAGGADKFLVLPNYAPQEDLLVIADAFGLEEPAKHIDYLEKVSRLPGRIRILFDTFQEAKQIAQDRPLTIKDLQAVRRVQ